MDDFNIVKRKIHLKHEPRGKFWDINGLTMDILIYLFKRKTW